jgi:hypothetical protein
VTGNTSSSRLEVVERQPASDRGWTFRLDADGALHVTTPSGVTRISRPPGGEWLEPYELGTVSLEFADLDPAPF